MEKMPSQGGKIEKFGLSQTEALRRDLMQSDTKEAEAQIKIFLEGMGYGADPEALKELATRAAYGGMSFEELQKALDSIALEH